MKFKSFLKEKLLTICLLIFAIITIEIFLMAYSTGLFIKIYIPIVIIGVYLITILCEYFCKKRYYKNLFNMLDKLEEKYLITEIIKTPEFIEGKILKEVLQEIDKSMYENVNKYKYLQEEYKEYIELWIHEVKTPITTSKMIIENNKSKVTKSILEELEKIENYTEQALFYARSSTVEKDYYIRKCNLKDVVMTSIKRNKRDLIHEKVEINIHDLDIVVNTDSKWLVFILNQIIQNSIKYIDNLKEKLPELEIYSKSNKDNVCLYIKDNGIGIKKSDLERVFLKGFTGENGRDSHKKSTGIGLYLCKKLCDKLGIGIKISSEIKVGTKLQIIFPNSSYITLK